MICKNFDAKQANNEFKREARDWRYDERAARMAEKKRLWAKRYSMGEQKLKEQFDHGGEA